MVCAVEPLKMVGQMPVGLGAIATTLEAQRECLNGSERLKWGGSVRKPWQSHYDTAALADAIASNLTQPLCLISVARSMSGA